MKLSITQKAVIAVCIVAVCYPLLNASTRFMNAGFGPFTQVYLRIALGLVLTHLFFFKEIHPAKLCKIGKKDWLLLIVMGTAGYGLAVDFITLGILRTKLLDVSIISSTTPFFVFLFSVLVLRKSFRYSLFLFLLIAFYGVFIISTKSFYSPLTNFGIGDMYVLIFAIGFGAYILARKYLSQHLTNAEISIIVLCIAFICSFITALILREPLSLTGFVNPSSAGGLVASGVLIVIATKLQNFGFEQLNSVVGSQLMLLQNIFAPILGFILFREMILPVEFTGALVVLIGVWAYIRNERD